jgi:hypothetical protein
VINAIRLIQHRLQHFDMTDVPPNTRKRRPSISFDDDEAEREEDEHGSAMSAMIPTQSVIRTEEGMVCDNPECNYQFVNRRAKFCRKCGTEKGRHITCFNCSAVCIFTHESRWCDYCGKNVFEPPMRVSDEGIRDESEI